MLPSFPRALPRAGSCSPRHGTLMPPCLTAHRHHASPAAGARRSTSSSQVPLCGPTLQRRPSRGVGGVTTTAATTQQTVCLDTRHRTERLIHLADEFITHWVEGARDGPTEEVLLRLGPITDGQVTIKTSHLLGKTEFTGLDGLRDKLTLDRHREGIMRPVRAVMRAASEDDDSVFCLLECQGEVAAVEKGTGVDKLEHKAYGLVKFDTLLDDTACRVTGLTERWQLGPSDAALLALHTPHHTGASMDSEEAKAAAVQAALQLAGSTHFPADRIREVSPQEFDSRAALRSMEQWCRARCSGEDEQQLLDQAFVGRDYRLWDAYGVLPLVCGIKPQRGGEAGSSGTSPSHCVMDAEQVLAMIHQSKAQHNIVCALLDKAVCPGHNVGFTHWRSCLRSTAAEGAAVGPGVDQPYVLEALELHVFTNDGQIMDTWMLRDPMQAEEEMLEEAARSPMSVAAGRPLA